MQFKWQSLVWIVTLLGLLSLGLLGTSTSTSFVWPAYLCLGLAGMLVVGLLFSESTFQPPKWQMVSVLALAGYLVIRASESPVHYFAREDVALVGACVLAYGIFLSVFNSGRHRLVLAAAFALIVLVHLGFAFVQKTGDGTTWLIPGYGRTIPERAGGLFNHPDHYAAFVGVLTPLWLSLALFGRQQGWVRRAWMALAGISCIVTLSTGASPAIFAMLTGGGLVLLLTWLLVKNRLPSEWRPRILAAGLGVAVLSTLVLAVQANTVSSQVRKQFLMKEGDVSLPAVWQAGVKQFLEQPWLGTGSRTSYLYSRKYRSGELGSHVPDTEFAHNEFIQLAADYGLMGVALLLICLLLHVASGWRFVRAYTHFHPQGAPALPRSDHLALVVGALGILGAMAWLSLFDFVLHLPVFAVTAAFFLALLAAPDPMAAVLKEKNATPIPGGSLMFVKRALTFGCGLATVLFGSFFAASEYHYEQARLAFEHDRYQFQAFRHLQIARRLDPQNPFVLSLSAHAQVAKITPTMAPQARFQALEQADRYFDQARRLYPQDVFAAVGHAAVLDELGKKDMAWERLKDAREWAPLYGNLKLAEAEHHMRHSRILQAENAYHEALQAPAFADVALAEQGLQSIDNWKMIARQNGVPWDTMDVMIADNAPADNRRRSGEPGSQRSLPDAIVEKRAVAGNPNLPESEPKAENEKATSVPSSEE